MKKLIALCLAMLLCLSVFAACDTGRSNEETTAGKEETTAGKEETTVAGGEETTVAGGEETTLAGGEETTVAGGEETTVAGGEETTVAGGEETTVAGGEETTVGGSEDTTAGGSEETTTSGSAYDVDAAIEFLNSQYKGKDPITAADYEVYGQVMIGLDKYMVTWTTDSDKVTVVEGSPKWTIQVDELSLETVNYKIIATVTAPDGTTATVSYDRVVPKFEVTSFEDYMAATEGTVTVAGIVVGINAKSAGNTRNHLFLADVEGKGGYYCYQLDKDPLEAGIALGMTVAVTAPVSPYSGMQETKGGDFVIIDDTIKDIPVLDITEKFAAGESLKNYVGLVVTIKGVTIGAQELEKDTSQYLWFAIGEKTGYVRTYVTDFPTTLTIVKDGSNVSSPDKDAIDAAHAANFGNTADATGILVLYSGAPYLIPTSTDCFSNYTVVTKTDAEKVEAEKEGLKLPASYTSDTVVDLAAVGQYYDDVAITWALAEANEAATLTDGKLTLVVPDAETIVKITATITCGEVTDTKSFEIKLSKSITSIKDAIEIGAAKDHNTYTEEKYLIAGIIKEVYNTTYGNMYIVDELGNEFTVYGSYIEGTKYGEFEGAKPVAGDYVVLLGSLGQYSGTAQMKNADIMSFTTPITIPEANELGNTFEKNQYTEDKKVITGEITEVQNTTYGNVVIKDAEGNSILVYGLYSSNGATRYDAMAKKPAVGDTITVLGIIGKYNAPQMKNGWLIAHTVASGEEGTDTPPAVEDAMTAEEILNALYGLADGEALTGSYTITGTITALDNYNNPTIVVEGFEDKPVYCYKLVVSNAVGDVITVTATSMKNYGGTYEFMNCTLVTEDNGGDNTEDTTTPPAVEDAMTAEEILNALYALNDGEALTGSYTITGTITALDNYNNPTIVVEGFEDKPVYCYKLVVSNAVGDVITVTATSMKNYGGTYEFMNCTLVTEDNGSDNTEDTTTPDAGEITPEGAKTYTFANYEAGEQYAAGEVHQLDDNVTVTTTDCHFTTQLRLYYSAVNDYNPNGRNGVAVFAMTSAVKSLSLNAGGKAGPIEVYGSTDGDSWTLITTIESTTTYTDYDVALGETAYTYIKLAATASQVRVASITIELQ